MSRRWGSPKPRPVQFAPVANGPWQIEKGTAVTCLMHP
jgi:hypothetical protein